MSYILRTRLDRALNDHESQYFFVVQFFLSLITIVSIAGIILETVQSLAYLGYILTAIEWISTLIFTVEYVARITVSAKKINYIFSFWGVIDLVSIAPTFIGLTNLTFLKTGRILRILRLLRTLRIAKISRAYLQSHDMATTQTEFNKINAFIYFVALFSAVVGFGAALYAAEHIQSAYANIPLAMIEAAKIILGGLGQAAPVTFTGEIIILFARLTGLALFGLLISVVGGVLNQWLFGSHAGK